MSNYTKTTNFATKDALASGNPAKIVKGTEIDTEFNNIAVASGTKADKASPVFTGTVTLPVTNADSLSIGGDGVTVTGIKDEDDMASNSATKLASQQSIKAYVDSQVTAQDLDVTDGTTSISIDLDSEALSLLGGTGVTSTASGNGVTMAIDATVATLSGSQTLTNKTLATPAVTGALTTNSTIDGRDVATDGTKLDTVETNADVTDTANVTAAGALMDSEVTNLAQVKAFDSTDYATAAQGTTADAALPKAGGAMTGAITTNSTFDGRDVATDGTKLDGIEALADVTDATNVTAAGALMDSELTSIASVKALDQGVATTDSPTFVDVTATSLDISGDIDVDGTTNLDATNIVGALDVTGTATMDGAEIDVTRSNTAGSGFLTLDLVGTSGDFAHRVDTSNAYYLDYYTGSAWRPTIKIEGQTGDISFYEDTGTTAKLFWDASAESLGIGTSSPSRELHISKAGQNGVRLTSTTFGADYGLLSSVGGQNGFGIYDYNASGYRFNIDSSGNVGIGVTDPIYPLEVQGEVGIELYSSSGGGDVLNLRPSLGDANKYNMSISSYDHSGGGVGPADGLSINGFDGVSISTGSSTARQERMRIDASGLVSIKNEAAPTLRLENTDTALSAEQVVGALEFFSSDPSGKGPNVTGYIETRAADSVGAGGNMVFATGAIGSSPEGERAIERMRIDASGNVGIGTDSPATGLHLEHSNAGATSGTIRIQDRDSQQDANQQTGGIEFYTQDATNPTEGVSTAIKSFSASSSGGAYLTLSTTDVNTSTLDERMRIDALGNASFNTTSISPSPNNVFGTALLQYGGASMSRINSTTLDLNRSTSDGAIIQFRKNGAGVGSIGTELADGTIPANLVITGGDTNASRLWLKGGDSGLMLDGHTNSVLPTDENSYEDNRTDLGSSDYRFKDLHLSGGVYLGGTVAANKLDDYEEGTWTPTASLGTFNEAAGLYVKVGDLVTVFFAINTATESTSTNEIKIKSLPFNSAGTSVSSHHAQGSVSYLDQLTGLNITGCLIRSDEINLVRDNTTLLVKYSDASGSWSVRGTVTYKVA